MRSGIRGLSALLVLSWVCGAQEAELTFIRSLAQQLHNAYVARDLGAVASLWSDQSPQKSSQLEAARTLFANPAISEIREATVGDPEWMGGHVRVRLDRETVAAPGSTPSGAGKAKLVLEWTRDGEAWRIWKESSAAEDLAARLAALPPAEKPDRLLAENQDLIGGELASALIASGASARNRGDLQKALAIFTLAGTIAEQAGAASVRALALNDEGLVYQDQGDFALALERYRKSLDLSEALHDDAGTSRTLTNLSGVYSGIGELSVASEYLGRSLAIGERLHDNRLITYALGSLAIVHARRGDYLHALSLLQKSNDLLRAGADKRALAANLNNIGNAYLWQGDLAQSQDYFQRELELATSAGLKPLVAVAWMGLGRVAEFRGDLQAAIGNYEKSLTILNETGNKPFAASDLTFIGSAYSKLGDQDKAAEYFQKGLEIQKAMRADSEGALTMGRIAEVYNRKGDFRKAADAAHEARDRAEASGLREALWQADLQAGWAAQGIGENSQAETHYRQAIATIEDLRRDVAGSESEQENFFENKIEPYYRMVALLASAGRAAEAFSYAERAKARVLLDVFQNGRAELSALMNADERQQDQAFRVRLATLNTQLARSRRASAPAQLDALTADLDRARLEYDRFENELYVRHPQWKLHTGAVEPVAIDRALAAIPGSGTAFVEFVLTGEQVIGFVSGSGTREQASAKLKVFTVPVSQDQLAQQVRRFEQQLAARDLSFRSTATTLYRLLIAPAGVDFQHERHLVLVPDGILWELPFQALVSPEGRYLLDQCAVSYAPSLTALQIMAEVRQRRREHPAAAPLLAMGNPARRAAAGRANPLDRDDNSGELPLAEKEVRSLGRVYGEPSRIYVGAQARETRFKAEAGDARVLHLATHAVLNNASPLYSYLRLADEPDNGAEDGILEARELLRMNLHAELAVLSACETARGHVGGGEGVIGLSWSLLVSGVPAMVVSQWKVESESTSAFMVAFHQNRKKSSSDAAALQAAALHLRQNPAYRHPFYWAPFIVIGAGLE